MIYVDDSLYHNKISEKYRKKPKNIELGIGEHCKEFILISVCTAMVLIIIMFYAFELKEGATKIKLLIEEEKSLT